MDRDLSKTERVYSVLVGIREIECLPEAERMSAENVRKYNGLVFELEHTPLSSSELIEVYREIDDYQKDKAKEAEELRQEEIAAHRKTKNKLSNIIRAAGPINALAKAIAEADN